MAREFEQISFFDKKLHANTYYANLIPIEYFLSQLLLKGDMKRLIYSSDEYSFAKRLMLADTQNGIQKDTITASNLDFPFANYYYDGSWDPDDRESSVQVMQMIQGQWESGLPTFLRSVAVKAKFTVTALYSRDDDARLAYEMALWEHLPKGPVIFVTPVQWEGVHLLIPVSITVEKPTFNPTFKESDWLKSQRIFPVKLDLTVRSYSIQARAPTNSAENPPRTVNSFNTGAGLLAATQNNLYITEEALLNFTSQKGWKNTTEQFDEPILEEYEMTEEEMQTLQAKVQAVTVDVVTGYFETSQEIEINECYVKPEEITSTSCILRWVISQHTADKLHTIKILVPGREPIEIQDRFQTSQEIQTLYPSSDYTITVLFYSTAGVITEFVLKVTTKEDESNEVKKPLTRKKGKLQGMTW